MSALFFWLWAWHGPDFSIHASRPDYKVNEPIVFQATLARAAYIYVFGYDTKTDELYLIWPQDLSAIERYPEGQWQIGDDDFLLSSDSPGIEHFIFAFSPTPLDLPERQLGDLPFQATMQTLQNQCDAIVETDVMINSSGGQK